MLPSSLVNPLRAHRVLVRELHAQDLAAGLPGVYSDVSTTMIYTHVLNRGGRGVVSPLDAR